MSQRAHIFGHLVPLVDNVYRDLEPVGGEATLGEV